jgi:hypothetical protein
MSTDESDELPYRGKELGGATAAVSCGFRPSFFRYLYYDSNLRFAASCSLVLFVATVLMGFGGYTLILWGGWFSLLLGILLAGLGVVSGLVGLMCAVLLLAVYFKNADYYESALLSPGIIHSRDPLVVMVLASMGNGSGRDYYGISRIDLDRLPYHTHERGTRLPCVCSFIYGDAPDHWAAFNTDFICYGTGDPVKIEECFRRLGDEPFEQLKNSLEGVPLPENADEIILLDAELNYLETIDKKAAKAAAMPPSEKKMTHDA